MDENTTKIIKERFDALPESVQEVILSSNYQNTLIQIGQQFNLNVEQLGKLEVETTMTMMALVPMADFETELTHELGIDKEKGIQIVRDINEKVFLKIRDLLKLMNTPTGEEPTVDESVEETQIKVSRIDSMMPKKIEIKEPEHNNEVQTFRNAGIEILPEENNLPVTEKLEIPTIQKPAPVVPTPSILAQKLSAPMQTPAVKTDHTLPNITPLSTPSKPAVDPYREIPE